MPPAIAGLLMKVRDKDRPVTVNAASDMEPFTATPSLNADTVAPTLLYGPGVAPTGTTTGTENVQLSPAESVPPLNAIAVSLPGSRDSVILDAASYSTAREGGLGRATKHPDHW